MIGAVENKLCTASNQTELTDNKPVIIYRIMTEDIVFSKSRGLFTKSLYIVKPPTSIVGRVTTDFGYTV